MREELRSEYLTPFEKIELKRYNKPYCTTMRTSSDSSEALREFPDEHYHAAKAEMELPIDSALVRRIA